MTSHTYLRRTGPLVGDDAANARDASPHDVRRTPARTAASGSFASPVAVGPARDQWEVEADSMADRVLHMPDPALTASAPRDLRPSGTTGQTSGEPLSGDLRSFMEPRFGLHFGAVRVHTGLEANRMNTQLGAVAFTRYNDIYASTAAVAWDRKVMAHELTHVAQQNRSAQFGGGPAGNLIQRMLACPPQLADSSPTPSGFTSYHGNSSVFHCGFRGILEDRIPTPTDPQNECFYDHSGTLVDQNHPYAGCAGTPNQYDSSRNPLDHTFRDTGGIVHAGGPAFITSRVHDITQAIAPAIAVVSAAGQLIGSIAAGFSNIIALGLLTGVATVDPGNWRFQNLPSRSIRHLNVMGAILGSAAAAGNVQILLQNLTRRLDSFAISGLLEEISADVNQALEAGGQGGQRSTAADLGQMSLVQLIEFLRVMGALAYIRVPEEIARDQLGAGSPSPEGGTAR